MRGINELIVVVVLVALTGVPQTVLARGGFRGGGMGGGFRGGMGAAGMSSFSRGGFGGAGASSFSRGGFSGNYGARAGGYGGYGANFGARPGGYGNFGGLSGFSGTGPHGGSWSGASTGINSHTGPAGGTYYHSAGAGTYTGPRGSTVSGAGRGGVYVGPNGAVMGRGGHVGTASGYRGGSAAIGGRSSFGVGPGGNFAARGSRGGVAIGPGGGVAAGGRYGRAGGYVNNGTFHVTNGYLHGRAAAVNGAFIHNGVFGRGWYSLYPRAWYPYRWAGAGLWATYGWASTAAYLGWAADPIAYDYGTNIVYNDDGQVYQDGTPVASQDDYAQQAQDIADTGRQAMPGDQEEWQALGVFGLVQGDDTTANDLFQLGINKQGVIRGNYYNALSETTLPVYGSVDQQTQRAAWSIGDKQDVVYEAGLSNLTQEATPCLVHFGKEKTQQLTLVRIEQPAGDGQDGGQPADGQPGDAAPVPAETPAEGVET